MKPYTDSYYRERYKTSLPSAERIVPLVVELLAPRSVIDLGCGDGSWLSIFRRHGATDLLGVDGGWLDPQHLKISTDEFRVARLDGPLEFDRQFDIAISLEVAEHLPPSKAAGFVACLTTLAPVVMFSAAIPAQGGVNHQNEQWPDYWEQHFANHGYMPIDVIRWQVWNDPAVAWWYSQNILLYAGKQTLAKNPSLSAARQAVPGPARAIVHPRLHQQLMRRSQPGFKTWLKMAPGALARSLRKLVGT